MQTVPADYCMDYGSSSAMKMSRKKIAKQFALLLRENQ
jgi:hypothetical protein